MKLRNLKKNMKIKLKNQKVIIVTLNELYIVLILN